jgi:ParB family chromosome partitioning protein
MFFDTDKLQPNPFQPRAKIVEDKDFSDLVASVTKHGVLEPLLVVATPAGTHIIAGERRWRAAKKVGLKQIPIHLVKTTPRGMLEMALVENIQRVDLTTLERAQALQRLIKEFHYTHRELGERIGKTREYVTFNLLCLELPDPVKDGLNRGLISEGHARALFGIADPEDTIRCYRQIIAEGASVRRAEEIGRQTKRRVKGDNNPVNHPALPPDSATIEVAKSLEKSWQEQCCSRPHVSLYDTSRSTKITIILKGDAQSRREDLEKFINVTRNLNSFNAQLDQMSTSANMKKTPVQ